MKEKLRVDHLFKSFGKGRRRVDVLNDLSLTVGDGEFVSIIGPSGSGKSTLFHIIGGLIAPTSGSVILDGEEVIGKRGRISYMPQDHALFPWRTIEDNVILAQEIAGMPIGKARAEARDWLARVGLTGYEQQYPHVLSGGMRQRVAFLRALLGPQELMCLDEPFGSLDALTRIDMQQWLLDLWEANQRSVLFVTHSIEEALFQSDRIYVISDKPAAVLQEIVVPYSRPRRQDSILRPEFISLRQEIHGIMRGLHAEGPLQVAQLR